MKRKQDIDFEDFCTLSQISHNAVGILEKLCSDYGEAQIINAKNLCSVQAKRAEVICRDTTFRLSRTFFTSIERADIIRLKRRLCDITHASDAAVLEFYISRPPKCRKDIIRLVGAAVDAVTYIQHVCNNMNDIKHPQKSLEKCAAARASTMTGETVLYEDLRALFQEEAPTKVLFGWSRIYESIGALFKALRIAADTVGDTIVLNI